MVLRSSAASPTRTAISLSNSATCILILQKPLRPVRVHFAFYCRKVTTPCGKVPRVQPSQHSPVELTTSTSGATRPSTTPLRRRQQPQATLCCVSPPAELARIHFQFAQTTSSCGKRHRGSSL